MRSRVVARCAASAAIALVSIVGLHARLRAQDPWAWEPTVWPETMVDEPLADCGGVDFTARLDRLASVVAAQSAPVVRGELSIASQSDACNLRSFRSDATAGPGALTAWSRAIEGTRLALARYSDAALERAYRAQVAGQRRRWHRRGPASMVHAGPMPAITLEVLFEIDAAGEVYLVVQRTAEHAVGLGGSGPCTPPPGVACDPAGPIEVAHFEIEDTVRVRIPMAGPPRLGRHRLVARGPFAYD